jgi:hypothetical protein
MIVQIDIGGVLVHFGEPQAPIKPEPFYPYLDAIQAINDSTGDETGSVQFTLKLKAIDLVYLNLRRKVLVLNDKLEIQFEGVIGRISYGEAIDVTVEA